MRADDAEGARAWVDANLELAPLWAIFEEGTPFTVLSGLSSQQSAVAPAPTS